MSLSSDIEKTLSQKFGKNVIKQSPSHFRIEITTKSNRSQVVEFLYLEKIDKTQNHSRYIALSPIGPIFRNFNYEEILKMNSKINIGAICIDDFQNQEGIRIPYLAVRATHIVITAQIEEIVELILEVAKLADSLESEIYSKDIY